MIGFVLILITGFIGLCAVIAAMVIKKPGPNDSYVRWPFAVVGLVLLFISGAGLIASTYSPVGTSQLGVVTAFGHTEGDLAPGIHFLPPWDDVTIWPERVQRSAFEGKNCLEIRIAGQQGACADVIVFWRDYPPASDAQFRAYTTFGSLAQAYFSPGILSKYYNNVFESYDPVTLASLTTSGKKGGATVTTLTNQVERNLKAAYFGKFTIVSLNTGPIRYSTQVEQALQRVVTAKANFNVSVLNKQTASNLAAANHSLQANGALTPTVVEQNCLTTTQTLAQAGYHWQPGWSCTGNSTGLIVNSSGH